MPLVIPSRVSCKCMKVHYANQAHLLDPGSTGCPEFNHLHPMVVRKTVLAIALISFWLWTGCVSCGTKQNPDQLREQTARATAEFKQDAKAVAQGVREGWSRNNAVDINQASREQLRTLPGITAERADRIIELRPYSDPHDLVTRKVISQAEYERIHDRITAKK